MGIIFSVIIVSAIIFIVTDPFNLRPLLSEFKGINLDVDSITEKITEEMTQEKINCLRIAVGEKRAQEIMNGATPNANDLLKASSCFTK